MTESPTAHLPLPIGQVVPGTRYRVTGSLGQGAMGAVFSVEHVELGRTYVLKCMRKSLLNNRQLVQRFRNEWRALGKLHHPNIIDVVDAGLTPQGLPFYVMQHLNGCTLDCLSPGVSMHPRRAIEIVTQMLSALAAAHKLHIVHRDIKPENVFVTNDDSVRVLDFGIAKLMGDDFATVMDRGALGTPRYMSPEQGRGEDVGAAADLYSTGVVLFELLAGRGPFAESETDVRSIVSAHVLKPPPRVSQLVSGIPPALDELIDAMLRKKPSQRPKSARWVAEALRRCAPTLPDVPAQRSRAHATTIFGGMTGLIAPGHPSLQPPTPRVQVPSASAPAPHAPIAVRQPSPLAKAIPFLPAEQLSRQPHSTLASPRSDASVLATRLDGGAVGAGREGMNATQLFRSGAPGRGGHPDAGDSLRPSTGTLISSTRPPRPWRLWTGIGAAIGVAASVSVGLVWALAADPSAVVSSAPEDATEMPAAPAPVDAEQGSSETAPTQEKLNAPAPAVTEGSEPTGDSRRSDETTPKAEPAPHMPHIIPVPSPAPSSGAITITPVDAPEASETSQPGIHPVPVADTK